MAAFDDLQRTIAETSCTQCENGFTLDRALLGTFDGMVALYQCPYCGQWTRGPPPGSRSRRVPTSQREGDSDR